MNWGAAWPHYQQALDWWAGQRELDRARDRYLKIVFRAAHPPRADEYYFYTYYGNYIPLDVLENALKISVSANETVAPQLPDRNDDALHRRWRCWDAQRVPDQFEDALKAGKQSEWYDDALYNYAEWMNNYGSLRQLEDGQWQQQPDYVKALELYRRLTREFSKGETRYYDQAQEQIKNITEPIARNRCVEHLSAWFRTTVWIEHSQHQARRSRALQIRHDSRRALHQLRERMKVTKVRVIQGPGFRNFHSPVARRSRRGPKTSTIAKLINLTANSARIDEKLPVGAYLLEAKSGSLSAREVVLISDATLVLKSSTNQALAFFADAVTGAPIANANVALWESYYRNDRWHWRRLRQTTDCGRARSLCTEKRLLTIATCLRRLRATTGRHLLPVTCLQHPAARRLAHLCFYRSPRISSQRNPSMEVHRTAFEWRSLYDSCEPGC